MKNQSTTRGFAILSLGTMLVKVLSLLYIPFLQRIIGISIYGDYALTYMVFTLIYVLTNSGIGSTVSKLIAESVAVDNYRNARKTFRIALRVSIILGLVMTLIMFFGAEYFSRLIKAENAVLALKFLAPTIMFSSIVSVYRGYFQGNNDMIPTAISQVAEQIANVAISLALAYFWKDKGPQWMLAGSIVGTPIASLIVLVYLQLKYSAIKRIHLKKGDTKAKVYRTKVIIKKIYRLALPITVSLGLTNVGSLIDNSIVKGRIINSLVTFNGLNLKAAEEMAKGLIGYLASYSTLINVPIALVTALSMAVLPAISSTAVRDGKKEVVSKINHAIKLCLLIAIPCAVGLSVLSKPLFEVLFDTSEDPLAYLLMAFGAFVIIFWSLMQIQITVLQGLGKVYVATLFMILGLVPRIITNYFLTFIPWIGIKGAIVGNYLNYLIPFIFISIYMKRNLKLKIKIKRQFIKPFIASLWMGVVCLVVYIPLEKLLLTIPFDPIKLKLSIALFFSIMIGMYFYLYVLIHIRFITYKDISDISPKIMKVLPQGLRDILNGNDKNVK